MKKSFRVATVFTGAVACATALTPMAEAATATATVTPDATAGNCAANSGPAVHLYYPANANHSLAACVKGGGYISFPGGKKFAGICGGEWWGSFYYGVPGTSISGVSYFSPGYLPIHWRQTDEIYGVRLNRYHYSQGETSCPNHG
jgi:hypothetical protein